MSAASSTRAPAVELTRAGRRWAMSHAAESIVCRVALAGTAGGWPAQHVKTATEVCNREGGTEPMPEPTTTTAGLTVTVEVTYDHEAAFARATDETGRTVGSGCSLLRVAGTWEIASDNAVAEAMAAARLALGVPAPEPYSLTVQL